jgi:transposase
MRGDERVQDGMFSYVTLEQRVPADHPLREIRALTDGVLQSLDSEFAKLYAATGRASIAPEYMLRALLLQAFYSIRSERQLVEQLDYNLLFRWFVGLGMDDAVWNHAVFSKNRDRLLNSEVAQQFFAAVNKQAKRFMSDDHFTVDGTLIPAWASHKSFRAKDGSDSDGGDGANFHGHKRSNDTHESTTDPDARLYKKSYGKESHLAYLGHALVENRNFPDRRRHGDPGRWLRRTRSRAADASGEAKRPQAAHHHRRGQGLRHEGFHRRHTRLERHRACDQEREGTPFEPRPPNHAASRLRYQPEPPMADRKGIWMAQADRSDPPGEAARTA